MDVVCQDDQGVLREVADLVDTAGHRPRFGSHIGAIVGDERVATDAACSTIDAAATEPDATVEVMPVIAVGAEIATTAHMRPNVTATTMQNAVRDDVLTIAPRHAFTSADR
ncbi:MAG: hypothetical protein U5N21_14765 [Rhodococcus sp. (in: high G+C Gram-positive bacteria)]|nr:hypothetical protein [Rhodococcus sp. (in: high G+C Gram-positive bacteria)]